MKRTNTTKAAATKAATTTPKATKAATTPKATKAVAVTPATTGWTFTPGNVGILGLTFPARYSVAKDTRDVYAFVPCMEGAPVRVKVAVGDPCYHAAFDAAMATAKAAKPDAKPVTPAKAEPKAPKANAPAKAEPKAPKAKAPAKPATPAKAEPKAPKAKAPAKAEPKAPKAAPVAPATPVADKAWVGTEITGKGWRIVFDDAANRTRVMFTKAPSAKQKAAVEAAGFYFSAGLNSWVKKLTCKAYRAAQALATTLGSL